MILPLLVIGFAAGCSMERDPVPPLTSNPAPPMGLTRDEVPEEYPRNGGMPPSGTVGDPYRPPAFTPHWSTPTLSALFRRLPGLRTRHAPPPEAIQGTLVPLPGDSSPTPSSPRESARLAPQATPAPPGLTDGKREHKAPRGARGHAPKDFHMMHPYLEGIASWYGPGFHGKDTANGETYNQNDLTAAHPTLPLGTVIKVRNLENNRVLGVRVNDRGPYAKGRILDLSKAAARRLGMLQKGTAPVRIEVMRWPRSFYANVGLRPYTQYVVQVAAYPDQDTAEAELERMRGRFPWTEFVLDYRAGGKLSVIAGPFDAETDAVKIAKRLQRNGVTSLTRRYRK